jgi:hypothetical protein
MKVELPRESKSFADINAGECFTFTREQVTSVCMKVELLSSDSIAVLWSESDDWTAPHLIAPTELARSILYLLPSAVFVASSDAKDIRAGATRHEHAPGFLIRTPAGQMLIAVKAPQREHGRPVIDVETGKLSGIESDNLTFFTSWRIVTKVLDKYETLCSFPPKNENQKSGDVPLLVEHCEAVAAEVDVTRRWLGEQGRRGLSGFSDVLRGRHVTQEVACEPSVVRSLWPLPA